MRPVSRRSFLGSLAAGAALSGLHGTAFGGEASVQPDTILALETPASKISIGAGGAVSEFAVRVGDTWEPVAMQGLDHAGPAWVLNGRTIPLKSTGAAGKFRGKSGAIEVQMVYRAEGNRIALQAGIRNTGKKTAKDLQASLRLGIDTYMEKYPDWNDRYFPTLLRCEKTHFWGFFMAPNGRILTVGSPDPVASWHLEYKQGLHRIYTATLDLLQTGPLPARHPQGLDSLKSGEEKQWTVYLEPVARLEDVKPCLAASLGAPMIECDRYTVEPGGQVNITIFAGAPRREVYTPGDKPGQYLYTAKSESGKIAEALISVRHPWNWYAKQARVEAIRKPQKASSHTESWYGLFSGFVARRHFPDPALDAQIEAKFQEILPLMYNLEKGVPVKMEDRVQNHACMGGLLALRHQVTGDVKDLEAAARLADYLIARQAPDGSYRSGKTYGGTHYTSVVYIGKSIMEIMAEERKLRAEPAWRDRYKRHYASVESAMDELARSRDNIQTEGELTYEDGMISCSCTQLAMFALLQQDSATRRKYLDAALYFANGHRCLSQMLVPDSRMNGGSLRFWEAQYDVLATPNMMSSPHGWSAWGIYGLWYLYLLTGDEDWLRQAMNALGSCVQLIEAHSGELRWGFVADPSVTAKVFEEDRVRPGTGRWVQRVVGEEYLPMISGWFRAKPSTWVTGYWATLEGRQDGGCCDNDVHEIFKCLGEVALTSAYVLERSEGSISAWNCTVRCETDGRLVIEPAEEVVSRVHLNLRHKRFMELRFAGSQPIAGEFEGMQWVGPGGVPEMLIPLSGPEKL